MCMLWYGFCYYLIGSDLFIYESNNKKILELVCYGFIYISFVSLSCL